MNLDCCDIMVWTNMGLAMILTKILHSLRFIASYSSNFYVQSNLKTFSNVIPFVEKVINLINARGINKRQILNEMECQF